MERDCLGESIGIRSVPNLRDIGGYKNSNGATVKRGLLYRSNQLINLSSSDMKALSSLSLKYIFDLRTLKERENYQTELPPDVTYVILDLLSDFTQMAPAQLEYYLKNPDKADIKFKEEEVEEFFCNSYRQFITLPSAKTGLRKFFLQIAKENSLPALYHCTTGKDRTGWLTAALLTLLGVSLDDVLNDYLKSNQYIIPLYQKLIDNFVSKGGKKETALAIIGVKKEYLLAAFDEMEKLYGSIEEYFYRGLGIDYEHQKKLKNIFLS